MKSSKRTGTGFVAMMVRIAIMLVMVATSVAMASSSASARTAGLGDVYAQGATWDTSPLGQRNRDDDDEEEPTEEDEEEPTEEDEDNDRGSSSDDDDLNEDWLDAGLISATEYESPMYGYTVEWDDPWELDLWYDDPKNGDSATGTVATDNDGADDLHIWYADTGAILRVQGLENANELTGEDYLEFWQSDDYYDGFTSDAELVVAEGDEDGAAVIFAMEGTNGWFVGYNQVIIADRGDTLIFLFFLSPVEDAADAYEAAQDGTVEVDGDEVFNLIRARDVDDAIEEVEELAA